jgi:hypothetical protein
MKHAFYVQYTFPFSLRVMAHQGNWQLQRDRNFREFLLASVQHMQLNGAAQIEETARNSAED